MSCPRDFTCLFVIRYCAASTYNNEFIKNKRRNTHTPRRGCRIVFFKNICRPNLFTRFKMQTVQNTCCSDSINTVTVNSWCCTRTESTKCRIIPRLISVCPLFFASVKVITDNLFPFVFLFLRNCRISYDSKT